MAGQLSGKVALVTGASSGIGRASALAFAREGAKVVVADVDVNGGEETVHQIQQDGGDAGFVAADVSKTADVQHMIWWTLERYGRLDCAHNNAGILASEAASTPLHEYPEDVWDRVVRVNLTGVWLCLKYEIAPMLRQGGGAIVNTASVAGLVGFPGGGDYVASKHGVVGLTKTAALDYAKQGIRVNAVCPGPLRSTAMSDRLIAAVPQLDERYEAFAPVGRLGAPEEVAAAVVWLCSDAASFVTGVALPVDGGWVAY
jgi:NAD(P)-dependent dehydrogenase (short-subunit alcohol dehydrogenase family)